MKEKNREKLRLPVGVGDFRFGTLEKKFIKKVIESNRLSYGPMTQEFESRFALEHGCRFGIFCNSGTSALHIALAALKEVYRWNDGDEIIVPAITFIATSNVVLHNNLRPVFVDVDRLTYNINPHLIEEKITEKNTCHHSCSSFWYAADMNQ